MADISIIKFRNYTPQTSLLEGTYTIERAKPGSIHHYVEDKLELASDETSAQDDNNFKDSNKYKIDPKLLEPKKGDWDLKRRIEKKLEKLERETRKEIDKQIKSRKNKK